MIPRTNEKILLFSIDFEDIRLMVPRGMTFREILPQMVEQFLEFMRDKKGKGTFFVVGQSVLLYQSLLKEIMTEGHEIAAHTHTHAPLDQHTRETFKDDMQRNLDVLHTIGATNIKGFRAPGLSLGRNTPWAYEVLEELGFTYSSSVMATKSAFHGWPEFGEEYKKVNNKIWEMPPTLMWDKEFFNVPFASSVYFRFLPLAFSKWAFKKKYEQGLPVISYFHSFDIDYQQEKFLHPGVNGSRLYDFLMRYNRKGMMKRFNSCLPDDVVIMPHAEYIKKYLEK